MAVDYKKYILSKSTHYISNSGGDEKKGTKGGKAGDQTGKEWQLKKWYNRPWTCVLRWPDIKVGTLIAQLSIDAALNNLIGYDQYQRNTYWTQLKKANYRPSQIKTACEEDCTAGVNANVHAAGYLLGIQSIQKIPATGIRSTNMRSHFKKAGFQVLTDKKYLTGYQYLLPGDILLYDDHHAAANVTAGKKVTYTYEDVLGRLDGADKKEYSVSDYLIVKGKYYVRVDADTKAAAITTANKGDRLPYLDETKNGWYKVLAGDQEGWISSKAGTLEHVATDYIKVRHGNYYVREDANKDAQAFAIVKEGEHIPYVGETKNGWYKVITNNKTGWLSIKAGDIVKII